MSIYSRPNLGYLGLLNITDLNLGKPRLYSLQKLFPAQSDTQSPFKPLAPLPGGNFRHIDSGVTLVSLKRPFSALTTKYFVRFQDATRLKRLRIGKPRAFKLTSHPIQLKKRQEEKFLMVTIGSNIDLFKSSLWVSIYITVNNLIRHPTTVFTSDKNSKPQINN